MSSTIPISSEGGGVAPTPVNTPLNAAPISGGMSRPTVPDISEEIDGEDADDPNAPLTTALSNLVQSRLAGLLGRSSGYVESLPLPIKRNVQGLKGIQVQNTELVNQYKRECLELERKYLELAKPLYTRRSQIIAGEATPTDEEVKKGEAESAKDDEDYVTLADAAKDQKESAAADATIKGIPEFWLTALRNHIGLSEIITDRDAEALKSLVDIKLEYLPTPTSSDDKTNPGFILSFYFTPNDYFTNDVLTKTYYYQAEVGYGGDFVYEKATGTDIAWKEEKDLTKEFEIRKQRNKNTNRTRIVRKSKPTESFFNFFAPPQAPSDEDIESGKVGEDELEEIEERLEVDYQIGEDIKEKVIPRAIDYFTGKALEWDALDEDSDDYSDEDSEGSENSDDDDDDDSDDSDVPRARRMGGGRGPITKVRGGVAGGKGGKGGAMANPEECKQQ